LTENPPRNFASTVTIEKQEQRPAKPQRVHRTTEDPLALVITRLLGAFWILDGILQFQPASFTHTFVTTVLFPNLQGQPAIISSLLNIGITNFSDHILVANLFAGVVQLSVGSVLLLARKGSIKRAALYISVVWSAGIWVVGEGLGNVFTGAATFYTGAPGSVLLYLILAVFLLYPRKLKLWKLPIAAGALFLFGALLQVLPTFWSSSGIQSVFQTTASDPIAPIASPSMSLVAAASSAPVLTNLTLVALLVAIGGLLIFKPGRTVALGAALFLLLVWWLCQDLGQIQTFPGGTATDPNSAPILILFLVPLFLGFRAIRPKYSSAAYGQQVTGV